MSLWGEVRWERDGGEKDQRWGQQAKKQRGEAGLHLRWGAQPRPSLVPPGSHRESLSSTATSSRTTWPIPTTTTTHEASRTVWRNNAGKRPRRLKGGTQIAGVGTLSETPCFGSSWVAPVASATITITLCLTLREEKVRLKIVRFYRQEWTDQKEIEQSFRKLSSFRKVLTVGFQVGIWI